MERILGWVGISVLLLTGCHFRRSVSYCDDNVCWACDQWGCEVIVDDRTPRPRPGGVGGSGGGVGGSGGGVGGSGGGAAPGQTCGRDDDCRADCYCASGRCEQTDGCTVTTDCLVGETCWGGLCRPIPAPAHPCTTDAECGPAGHCDTGSCDRSCVTSTDCGTGRLCQSGRCADRPPTAGASCAITCPSGGTCIDGVCHAACDGAQTCGNLADACVNYVCVPERGRVAECRVTADCEAGLECVDAACRAACASNADCQSCGAGGATCNLGFCQ